MRMGLGLGMSLLGTTALTTTITRLAEVRIYGSSTPSGVNSVATTDDRNNPVLIQGITFQAQLYANTLPHSGAPLIVQRALTGDNEDQITTKLLTTDAGLHSGKDICAQIGGNPVSITSMATTEANLTSKSISIISGLISGSARSICMFPAFDTSSNIAPNAPVMPFHQVRLRKYIQSLNRPNVGSIPLNYLHKRWAGPERLAADIIDQYDFLRPKTLVALGEVHDNCTGQRLFGDGLTPWLEAVNGGPTFFPECEYYGAGTAAGDKLCNLQYFGNPVGETITCLDSRFAITVNPSGTNGAEVELRLAGAVLPTQANTYVTILSTRSGYPTRTSYISVSVKTRVGTVNGVVRVSNQAALHSPNPLFSATSTVFSMVIIVSRGQDDGTNPHMTAGGSDSRLHQIYKSPWIDIALTNAGAIKVTLRDPTPATAFTVTSLTNKFSIARGRRCYALSFDNAAGTKLKTWLSKGQDGDASSITNSGTTPGNGTLNLNGAGLSCIFNSTAFDPSNLTYFEGTSYLIWMSSAGAIDWTNSAKQALVYNDTTGAIVDLGPSGTIDGLAPDVLIRGCAAEMQNGAATIYSDSNGYMTALNEGAGGPLFTRTYGTLTDV